METKDRIIFTGGEKRTITEEEYHKSLEPHEQQKELFSHLKAWNDKAVEVLKAYQYTEFLIYGGTYKLVCHPTAIESEENNVRDADTVLRAIHDLYGAIFQDDKSRIANAGMQVGLAIGKAHTLNFEGFAVSGKKSSEGHKNRADHDRKESFQDWIKENPEKIKDCKTVKDLLKIERIKACRVKDETLKKMV